MKIASLSVDERQFTHDIAISQIVVPSASRCKCFLAKIKNQTRPSSQSIDYESTDVLVNTEFLPSVVVWCRL